MPYAAPTHKPKASGAKVYKAPEQERGTSTQRGYGYRWQQARKGWLAKHPWCVDCEAIGRNHVLATDVDHIIPHRGDKDLFWDRNNWQSLCHMHHSAKTGRGQ
jgi:5-methylcytosine-specific restriction protein A